MKNHDNLIFLFASLSLHLFFVFYLGAVMNETSFNKQFFCDLITKNQKF